MHQPTEKTAVFGTQINQVSFIRTPVLGSGFVASLYTKDAQQHDPTSGNRTFAGNGRVVLRRDLVAGEAIFLCSQGIHLLVDWHPSANKVAAPYGHCGIEPQKTQRAQKRILSRPLRDHFLLFVLFVLFAFFVVKVSNAPPRKAQKRRVTLKPKVAQQHVPTIQSTVLGLG